MLNVVFGVALTAAVGFMFRDIVPIWWDEIRRNLAYQEWAEDIEDTSWQ